jgi:hypothetical protein
MVGFRGGDGSSSAASEATRDSAARDARLRARKVVGAADDELSGSIRSAQVQVVPLEP